MYTMGVAVRIVTEWLNNPAAVVEYSCRFTRPVPVPDDNVGARLVVNAQVTELLPENRAVLSLTATCDSVAVLGKARVVVQLPA